MARRAAPRTIISAPETSSPTSVACCRFASAAYIEFHRTLAVTENGKVQKTHPSSPARHRDDVGPLSRE